MLFRRRPQIQTKMNGDGKELDAEGKAGCENKVMKSTSLPSICLLQGWVSLQHEGAWIRLSVNGSEEVAVGLRGARGGEESQ